MNTLELLELLNKSGFTEGFAIRNGEIVLWENEQDVPESLAVYVNLDVIDNGDNN